MATQVQWRGGSEAEHATFTGAAKEVTVDTTLKTLRVHDGTTPGGFPLARKDELTAAFDSIKTSYYGTVDPSIDPANGVIAGSTWADTSTNTFKRRNDTNTDWVIEKDLFIDARVTSSASDTTSGRVLKTGDWGIGGVLPVFNAIDILADDDYYEYYVTAAVNVPAGAGSTDGYVKKEKQNASQRKVTFTPANGQGPWINVCFGGVWGGWVELYHSGNLPSASETVAGLLEIATTAEAQALTDDVRALTPKKLADVMNQPKWLDVTASRAFNTVYTNTRGRPVEVCITGGATGAGGFFTVNIDGAPRIRSTPGYTADKTTSVTFTVPAGSTYQAVPTVCNLSLWSELLP